MGLTRSVFRLGLFGVLLLGGLAAALLGARQGAAVGPATTTTSATSGSTTTGVVTSPAASVLVVSGHGWGHGLGMSQWGAYGYAKHGWTFDRILAHYYSGTTLGPAKLATVRVLLSEKKKTSLNSAVAWSVTDAAGTKVPLDPGLLA
jgi:stage II sporulation protein D